MADVGRGILNVALSPVAALAKAIAPKKAKAGGPQGAPPLPSRNLAYEQARMRAGELARRRGAGAMELTGGGAEAVTPGGKTLLGQ